jgi:PEP-CTERM motif-containing protein
MRLGPAILVASLLVSRAASAAPIEWQLNGVITSSPSGNPLEGYLPVGTDVSFLIGVDPTAPDLCDAAGAGFYQLPSTTISFGGISYTASATYLEANNPDGSCVAGVPTGMTIRTFFDFGTAPFSGATIGWFALGEALQTTPPSSGYFWVSYADRDPTVSGDFTSGAAVPEPSTFLLMLPALSAIVARRRRLR